MYQNFGVQSTGFKETAEIILDIKETKRIEHILHYLSITGQLTLTDFMFLECLRDHLKEVTRDT